jgi:2'-5' RNA ligase
MADKILCVLAGYDEKTEARLAALQNRLYENGFAGTQTRNIPQHITLGTFSPEEEEALLPRMRQAAGECAPFPVTFNHAGVFGGARVLFIAPDISHELLRLKEHFGPACGWTAHTTMLIDEPQTIYQALPLVMEGFSAFAGEVSSLHLFEFLPTRHILSLPLGG